MGKTNFKVHPKLATLLGDTYNSSELAIRELVDNAYDAEATEVRITLPELNTEQPIIIVDNGSGMIPIEVEQEYLNIAHSRTSRKGRTTPNKKRKVRGKKGVGKFSGLMVASVMELKTWCRKKETQLLISEKDIIESDKDIESIDLPFNTLEIQTEDTGTQITLSGLKQYLNFPSADGLKQLLILEYGRQDDFAVYVNDELLAVEDIPGEIVEEEIELPEAGKVKLRFKISPDKPLKQSGIVLRVNGKIIGKPHHFGLEDNDEIPAKLRKRVYGEIIADDIPDDIIAANWSSIIENSKAYEEIKDFVSDNLLHNYKNAFINEINLQKGRLQQEINRRLEKLPEYKRESAERHLNRVLKNFYGEKDDRIRPIIDVVLDAFENDDYWLVIQKLEQSKDRDVAVLADVISEFGLLDIALMTKQAKRRLEILDEIDDIAFNRDATEDEMHQMLEDNSWIFGYEFSVISSNRTLKRVVEEKFGKKYDGENAKKRPDLFLGESFSGTHLLIEFKRSKFVIDEDTESQAKKYRNELMSYVSSSRMDILLLGGVIHPHIRDYKENGVEFKTYSSLISAARNHLQWLLKELVA